MAEPDVNYELAYSGAIARMEILAKQYETLLKAAKTVLRAENKYQMNDALEELADAIPKPIGGHSPTA